MSRSASTSARPATMRAALVAGSLALLTAAGAGWAETASGSATATPTTCPPQTLEARPSFLLPPLAAQEEVTPGTVLDGSTFAEAASRAGAPAGVTVQTNVVDWQRDGLPFSSSDSYAVTVEDIGTSLVQVAAVTMTEACRSNVVLGSTPAVRVVAPTDVRLKSSRPGVVAIRVDQVGEASPAGFVTVKWTGTDRGSVTVELRPSANGRATVRLPLTRAGKYKVNGQFADTTGNAAGSRSSTLKLKLK